jgi:hypothetical protein
MKTHPLKISLIIMGISGTTAQIILLRELLISFFGNELTLGIILANWLILEAIGSFIIGKSVEKIEEKKEVYVLWQLIFLWPYLSRFTFQEYSRTFFSSLQAKGSALSLSFIRHFSFFFL